MYFLLNGHVQKVISGSQYYSIFVGTYLYNTVIIIIIEGYLSGQFM